MFARFTRLPLRRSLHTASAAAHPAPRFANPWLLGASAVATAYVSWRVASADGIHNDSPSKPSTSKTSPVSSPSTPSQPPPTPTQPAPPAPSSEGVTEGASPETTPAASGEGKAPEAEGEAGTSSGGSSGGGGGGGAYNPETGEINWDCPCLGGMAHGPCGEQFKEAFSCFVFSEDEPKGINCVDAFKRMQDCFREHPEVYADEIMDDDDDEPAKPAPAGTAGDDEPASAAEPTKPASEFVEDPQPEEQAPSSAATTTSQ